MPKKLKKKIMIFFGVLLIIIISGIMLKNYEDKKALKGIYREATEESIEPVIFIHFFDWFLEDSWIEEDFVDKLSWEELGILGKDRESEEFYYKQFVYIKSLGIDALAWEYHPRKGAEPLYPSENAIRALQRAELKIAPFFDYEVALKVFKEEEGVATLSQEGAISPDAEEVEFIAGYLEAFYKSVPKELRACDGKGRTVIYVYGYDFNDNSKPQEWNNFAEILVNRIEKSIGAEPAFYWSYKNSSFAEHLFLKHRENFIPFQFVLDTPQGQFGHDSATWNLGFDNLGVQVRDGLKRVIRLDERYLKEMGWLSKATNPAAIFIYGWNEPFEGSIVMPTEKWGDTKARIIKAYIKRLKHGENKILKKVLLIVDDLDNYYLQGETDWHYTIERQLLLYSMRRFLPQADVCTTSEISEQLLDQYPCIVDISVDKEIEQRRWLVERMINQQILCFDPKAVYEDTELVNYFAEAEGVFNINDDVQILGSLTRRSVDIFARDDILVLGKMRGGSKKILEIFDKGIRNPIIITNKDDIFVNSYNSEELILKKAFEAFYGVDLVKSILYGEGHLSQRLEIENLYDEPVKNTLERFSINQYWELPQDISWDVIPEQVDERYYDFIFGR